MAEKVESFVFGKAGKYDWDAWFDGDVWKLKVGEDIESAEKFRGSAYVEGGKRGLKVQVSVRNTDVFVQAVPR